MEARSQRDAEISSLIRLKQRPPAPMERWKMVPVVRSTTAPSSKPALPRRPSSPLLPRPTNIQPKSPEPKSRIAIKYKKTPSTSKTPGHGSKTPGHGSKTPKSAGKKTPGGKNAYTPSSCRYIPSRVTGDVEYSSFLLQQNERQKDEDGEGKEYRQRLLGALSHSRGRQQQRGVLSFKVNTPSRHSSSLLDYSGSVVGEGCGVGGGSSHTSRLRTIAPEKILDAPTIVDDYYLNNLDWGKNNQVAIGLGGGVYLWNATTGTVHMLMEMSSRDEESYVSSVSWSRNGKFLAIGGSDAVIQLWDVEKEKKIRSMRGHSDRVGALAWNKHTLTSASRDGTILYNDVRKAEPVICSSHYHKDEVCGLEWSPDGSKLASGGNDNVVCVWNNRNSSQPAQILKGHESAVKAVAWCPWKTNTLATGGGSKDCRIRLWNSFTGECTQCVDTGSQVSSLAWNKDHRQVISAHGLPRNLMTVWQYPSLHKVAELSGHSDRILHMCLSPRRGRVASAGSDETLRIWQCFERLQHDVSQRSYSEESITALLHSFH